MNKNKVTSARELIGWVIKSKEKFNNNKYNIKANEEFEIINVINREVVLSDAEANEYYINLDYIRKKFELVCELS